MQYVSTRGKAPVLGFEEVMLSGLASDGSRLYLSDGSSRIRVLVPGTMSVERILDVKESGRAVWMLNELE